MTIVNFEIIGNKMTSTIDGFGKEELQKVLDKLNSDYKWHLEIYSETEIKGSGETNIPLYTGL